MAVVIILLAIWLGLAFWAGSIASGKGRSFGGFFVLGLVLGIFGVIIAACVGSDRGRA
jgi:hypothetical protein